ncbi:MAG: response regulator [candidate division KSB1 bacterium]|nr:response regulator [candidate division KSB1 bacterium]
MREKRILLVEDDENDMLLTLRSLKDSNIVNPIDVVRDGVEALDYLLGRGQYSDHQERDAPAVVLLDLKLPKLGGLEVLRHIRSEPRTKHLPVVILTSSSEEKDIINGYKLGANSYVRKPVEFEQFCSAVKQLGCYWVLLNQAPPIEGNCL